MIGFRRTHRGAAGSSASAMVLAICLLLGTAAIAQENSRLNGTWQVTAGTTRTIMVLEVHGKKLSGTFGNTPIEGTVYGPAFHFTLKGSQGVLQDVTGAVQPNGSLSGEIKTAKESIPWTASRPMM